MCSSAVHCSWATAVCNCVRLTGQFSGLQHPQIRKANGALTKGYSVVTLPSVRKHRCENCSRMVSPRT